MKLIFSKFWKRSGKSTHGRKKFKGISTISGNAVVNFFNKQNRFSEDYQPVMLGSRALIFGSCSLKALNWHVSGRFVMFSGPIQFEELEFPQSLVEKAEKREYFKNT